MRGEGHVLGLSRPSGRGPLSLFGPVSKTAASGVLILSALAVPRGCLPALSVLLSISALQLALAAPRGGWLLTRLSPLLLSLVAVSVLALPLGAEPGALLDMAGRSAACVLSLSALLSSTPPGQVLWALRRLKVPASVVAIAALSGRYLLLLAEEGVRLNRAWRARACGNEGLVASVKVLPKLLGALLVRAVERGERVGLAMLARRFDGEFRTLRPQGEGTWGAVYATIFVLSSLGTVALGWTLWR